MSDEREIEDVVQVLSAAQWTLADFDDRNSYRERLRHSRRTEMTDPDRASWLPAELAMVFSARDQIALNRRCERPIGSLCEASSLTNPCECLEDAVHRVVRDLMDGGRE